MEGDYENVSHIQPPRYTETYDIPPQLFHQPTSIPDKNSFDNNSNINTGINDAPNVDSNSNINVEYYDTPSQIMKQPVSTPGKTDFDHNSNVNTGKNDDSIMGMQQPASVSNKTELNSNSNNVNYDTPPQWKEHTAPVKDKAELDSNSNVNTGNYDTPPQWRQQPSSVPDKKELDDVGYYDDLLNVNQEPATISNKSELEKNLASSKETSKSNTQEEDKTVLLRFNEFGTASGIMMIINMVLLFISWCVIVGWKSNESKWELFYDETHFFLSTTVLPFFISAIICFLIFCGVPKRIERANWDLALVVHCALWSVMLMISPIVFAVKVADVNNGNWCRCEKCHELYAGYGFGLLASVGLFVQALLHLLEFIRSKSHIKCQCC